jgi:tetratricopeptide (TPR) repeat protein
VLKLNPDHAEARDLQGSVDQLQKQAEVIAEDTLRKERIVPLMQSGQALVQQKRYEEAILKFNEVLAIDTTESEALRLRDLSKELAAKDAYNGALRAARDGDLKTSAGLAEKALRYKPNYPEASELLKTVGQKRAVVDEVRSKELYRNSLDAFLAGDPQQALELAVKALDLDPNNVEALRMRDRILQQGYRAP